jgi:hypothetical protein
MNGRRLIPVLLLVAVVAALAGCSGDDGTEPATGTVKKNAAAPAQGTPGHSGVSASPRKALQTLREQAAKASSKLAGISESDLLPSEQGAALLVERGYIEEARFCAADETAAYDAELGPEAEAAFEAGWAENAPHDLSDLGGATYNALSIGCFA